VNNTHGVTMKRTIALAALVLLASGAAHAGAGGVYLKSAALWIEATAEYTNDASAAEYLEKIHAAIAKAEDASSASPERKS
jgi:hypothetical protein